MNNAEKHGWITKDRNKVLFLKQWLFEVYYTKKNLEEAEVQLVECNSRHLKYFVISVKRSINAGYLKYLTP